MKNTNNLHDFVNGLKQIDNPEKVNMELSKIKGILNNPEKILSENLPLDLKIINESEVQKEEMKKIRQIIKRT